MKEQLGNKLFQFAMQWDGVGTIEDGYTKEKAIEDVSNLESAQKVIDELLEILMSEGV